MTQLLKHQENRSGKSCFIYTRKDRYKYMKKNFRVRKNEDFNKIISKKISLASSSFIIYKNKNDIDHGRVGISVSKKLGKAVVRNKIKRQLRMMICECFSFEENIDYIVIVRKNFLNHTYLENKSELESLYKKLKKRRISSHDLGQQN